MEFFGVDSFGNDVYRYWLENDQIKVGVLSYGGTLQSLLVKSTSGEFVDVLLGCDNMQDYLEGVCYFGSLVGRCAGRIKNATYNWNGCDVKLVKSQGENQLHGGTFAFDKKIWSIAQGENCISCKLDSPNGEQGFPGNLQCEVKYSICGGTLEISYCATCDMDTVFNMTNHAYFNLDGEGVGKINGNLLELNCDKFVPMDEFSIPLGELASVENTPFDFRIAKPIGRDIDADDHQIRMGAGFDHAFKINGLAGDFRNCAVAKSPKTGIVMKVNTDADGVVLYSANWVENQKGKSGKVYNQREAFCLETQFLPDAINQPNFATPILKAGETFETRTTFQFEVEV